MTRGWLIMIGVALLTLTACGGPTQPTDDNADFSGTWHGYDSVRGGNDTLTVVQSAGGGFSGTWGNNLGFGGTIAGSRSGANISWQLIGNTTSCSLNFTGVASSLTVIAGTLTGQNCIGNGGAAVTWTKS
jgi:hypothetical protein